MVDYTGGQLYRDRLQWAFDRSGKTMKEFAEVLRVTPNGVKKALAGGDKGTSAMTAENNSITARFLGVDAHWLATGEGDPCALTAWPFVNLQPHEWPLVDIKVREAAEAMLRHAIGLHGVPVRVTDHETRNESDQASSRVAVVAHNKAERSWAHSESLVGSKSAPTKRSQAGGQLINPSPPSRPATKRKPKAGPFK